MIEIMSIISEELITENVCDSLDRKKANGEVVNVPTYPFKIEDGEGIISFSRDKIDPDNLFKSSIPPEFTGMPEENIKELRETGTTTYTRVVKTTTTVTNRNDYYTVEDTSESKEYEESDGKSVVATLSKQYIPIGTIITYNPENGERVEVVEALENIGENCKYLLRSKNLIPRESLKVGVPWYRIQGVPQKYVH